MNKCFDIALTESNVQKAATSLSGEKFQVWFARYQAEQAKAAKAKASEEAPVFFDSWEDKKTGKTVHAIKVAPLGFRKGSFQPETAIRLMGALPDLAAHLLIIDETMASAKGWDSNSTTFDLPALKRTIEALAAVYKTAAQAKKS